MLENLHNSLGYNRQNGSKPKALTKPGLDIELQSTDTQIQWRYKGFREWKTLVAIRDLRGTDGKNGAPGQQGPPGPPGPPGKNGSIGPTGQKGNQGPMGIPGLDGADGKPGKNGQDGKDIELRKSATHIQWRYANGGEWQNLISLTSLTGPKGEKGEKGERGRNGLDGAAGARGPQGYTGPPGPPGGGGGGGIESVIAGTNVTVDNTDPANPIVSSTGGAASQFITEGDMGILVIRMKGPTTIWDMAIDDLGQWVSTEVTSGLTGSPIGLLLSLTYS